MPGLSVAGRTHEIVIEVIERDRRCEPSVSFEF
jgi:hypothetical protein